MGITKSIDYIKYLVAISKKGWSLKGGAETIKTLEMCLDVVSNDGQPLECVPEELKTKKCVKQQFERMDGL